MIRRFTALAALLGAVALVGAACAPAPPTDWRVSPDSITVNDSEDNDAGDEPYVIQVGFRSKLGVPGSSDASVASQCSTGNLPANDAAPNGTTGDHPTGLRRHHLPRRAEPRPRRPGDGPGSAVRGHRHAQLRDGARRDLRVVRGDRRAAVAAGGHARGRARTADRQRRHPADGRGPGQPGPREPRRLRRRCRQPDRSGHRGPRQPGRHHRRRGADPPADPRRADRSVQHGPRDRRGLLARSRAGLHPRRRTPQRAADPCRHAEPVERDLPSSTRPWRTTPTGAASLADRSLDGPERSVDRSNGHPPSGFGTCGVDPGGGFVVAGADRASISASRAASGPPNRNDAVGRARPSSAARSASASSKRP